MPAIFVFPPGRPEALIFTGGQLFSRFQSCAKLGQRLDQIANGTFPHAWIAIQDVFAISQGEKCGEEARRRPGIADEEFGF